MDEDHIEKRLNLYESAKKERSPHENKRHKVIQFAFPHMKDQTKTAQYHILIYTPSCDTDSQRAILSMIAAM